MVLELIVKFVYQFVFDFELVNVKLIVSQRMTVDYIVLAQEV